MEGWKGRRKKREERRICVPKKDFKSRWPRPTSCLMGLRLTIVYAMLRQSSQIAVAETARQL